ncbi:MAG: hypothetical protein V4692_00815, partial [Bdellovibrionota bacterium]
MLKAIGEKSFDSLIANTIP